jgi:hypothetical protein
VKVLPTILLLVTAACASPATRTSPYVATATDTVSLMALSPGGGVLGDAVAAKLAEQGFGVMPADATAALMQRQGLSTFELPQLGGLSFLRANGIDAVLIVRGPEAGAPVESARATVLRVSDGRAIAESQWRKRFRIDLPNDDPAEGLALDLARRLRG